MPLVRRKITQVSQTTFGRHVVDHTFFVPAKQVRPTDQVVPPSDGHLADLAYRFPKEWSGVGKLTFVQLAKERGVRPYEPPAEDPMSQDEEQLTAMANMAVKMFPSLKESDALALVDSTQDLAVLKAFFQAELDSAKPRAKVVAAFRARGLVVVDEEPEPEDDGEPGQAGGDAGA